MRSSPLIRALTWAAVLALPGCNQPAFSTGLGEGAELRVDLSTNLIHKGESVLLRAVLQESGDRILSGDVVSWSSSSPAVASVSATGLVQGIGLGSTEIMAVYGSESARVSIVVAEGPACAPAMVPEGCPPPVQ